MEGSDDGRPCAETRKNAENTHEKRKKVVVRDRGVERRKADKAGSQQAVLAEFEST